MICAVLGEGWTDILQFSSERAAFLHPVVQYGDALIKGPEDVSVLYNALERPRLMERLGLSSSSSDRAAWDALRLAAAPPPSDYDDLCAMVARNRQRLRKVRMSVEEAGAAVETEVKAARKRGPRKAAAVQPAAVQPADGERVDGEVTAIGEKPRRVVRAPRAPMPDSTVLHYSNDTEGVPWSREHMPCRPGTARSERFEKFVEGMTVGELHAQGIPHALIHTYVDRGWIHPENHAAGRENPSASGTPNAVDYDEEEAA